MLEKIATMLLIVLALIFTAFGEEPANANASSSETTQIYKVSEAGDDAATSTTHHADCPHARKATEEVKHSDCPHARKATEEVKHSDCPHAKDKDHECPHATAKSDGHECTHAHGVEETSKSSGNAKIEHNCPHNKAKGTVTPSGKHPCDRNN